MSRVHFRTALLSIRTRLLAANIGIILVSTSLLTLIAGSQITGSVRSDYEAALRSTIQLISRGVAPTVLAYRAGQINDSGLAAAFHDYETQTGGVLTLYFTGAEGEAVADLSTHILPLNQLDSYPELEQAIHEDYGLFERRSNQGSTILYTAASIRSKDKPIGLIQLAVPAITMNALVIQRWLSLALGFLLLSALAVAATLWIARSIINPLSTLRASAARLAAGDLSARVPLARHDEFGEVARTFNEMASQLQHTLDEQRAFTSNASHELRTPLTNIRLRTEALLYDAELGTEIARQYITEINDEAERLTALIQELALLSRLEAGNLERGHDHIDIGRFASSFCQQYAEAAADKLISLMVEFPSEPLLVIANTGHLTVIFRNLLENAMKYTPEGGRIVWNVRHSEQYVELQITDSGLGIGTQDLPHIFERFYRADRARSKDIQGTGLGLALVKSLLSLYAAQINITSDGIGKGTTATVLWPLFREQIVGFSETR